MIDASFTEPTATIRVVSGKLDVTYEISPCRLPKGEGFKLDLAGMERRDRGQAPFILAAKDYETVARRALWKARRLERAWRNTGAVTA